MIFFSSDDCNIELTEAGSFLSPNYPGYYPNTVKCTTLIAAKPGMLVTLRFHSFQLENYYYDFLAIYDSNRADNRTMIGRYSGSSIPTWIYSSGRYLYLEFETDGSGQYDGYHAEVSFYPSKLILIYHSIVNHAL